MVGIEDTAIGVPIRQTGRTLDEHELTEHDQRVEEDLGLAAWLGVTDIRYGVPWYRIHPAPGRFRWELADHAIETATRLGLRVVVDLVHYGVPGWVPNGFADPAYPDAIEAYADAFATRYRDVVTHYTPLNEPTVTAAFCGEFGGWPPYLTGTQGWTCVALAVALGIQRSIGSIRAAIPNATIVHVEASKLVRPVELALREQARLSEARAWLPTDLVMGLVNDTHPMRDWLDRNGASVTVLDALVAQRPLVDVMGVNFYPQFSVRELVTRNDRVVEVAGGGTGEDLVAVLRAFADRYHLPVAVTETSLDGTETERAAWLRASVDAIERARANGLPMWGYTWWPLFDFVDWGIATGDMPFEDFEVRVVDQDGTELITPMPSPGLGADPADGVGPWLRRMGLWHLEATSSGLQRRETSAATRFRELVTGS